MPTLSILSFPDTTTRGKLYARRRNVRISLFPFECGTACLPRITTERAHNLIGGLLSRPVGTCAWQQRHVAAQTNGLPKRKTWELHARPCSNSPDTSMRLKKLGAVERTRTSTGVSPQRPQRCASTSSATTAHYLASLDAEVIAKLPTSHKPRLIGAAPSYSRPTVQKKAPSELIGSQVRAAQVMTLLWPSPVSGRSPKKIR